MKVEVKLLAHLKKYLPHTEADGYTYTLEIDEGSTVRGVLTQVGVPEEIAKLIMINNQSAHLEDILQAGDKLIVIPPIPGG